jgi:hypothetical protein
VNQNGAILIMCLIVLSALALLLISLSEQLILEQKMINALIKIDTNYYNIENLINEVVSNKEKCIYTEKPLKKIKELLSTNHACHIERHAMKINYLIESLGIFPCLKTIIDEKQFSSMHYRVSFLINNVRLIQKRYVAPQKDETCDKEITIIYPGFINRRDTYLS